MHVFCPTHGIQLQTTELGVQVFVMAKVHGRRPYKVFNGDRLVCPFRDCGANIIRTNERPFWEAHHKDEPPLFRPHVDVMCEEGR